MTTTCHFLFGKEPNALFDSKQFSDEVVNKSLEILMRVNIVFLSRKEDDGFFFLDPVSFNNQCHLYSLYTAQIKVGYKNKSLEEKLARTQTNRFLHLSFLLSSSFINDRPMLCTAVKCAAQKKEICMLLPEKDFEKFIKGPHSILIGAARISLNEMFKLHIKGSLEVAKDKSKLHAEIYRFSQNENLYHKAERGNLNLYTLPKLVGVAYLVNEVVPMAFKIKVIDETGTGTLHFYNEEFNKALPFNDDKPALIFEAIASKNFSIMDFRKEAAQCPTFFERNPSSKNRHDEKKSCHFCTQNQADLTPYKIGLKKAAEEVNNTLYAMAADFITELQPSFKALLENKDQYPQLYEIFNKALENRHTLGVSMQNPTAFTISHVHVDSIAHALLPKLRMESSPQTYVKQRGFL